MLRLSESELLSELHDLAHTPGLERIQVTWEPEDDSAEGVGGCCLLAVAMPHLLPCPSELRRIHISATGEVPSDRYATAESLRASLNEARHRAGFGDLDNVRVRPTETHDGRVHYNLEKVIQ